MAIPESPNRISIKRPKDNSNLFLIDIGKPGLQEKNQFIRTVEKALYPRPDPASPVQPAFRCALKEGHGGPGLQRFFPVVPGPPLLSAGTAYRGGAQLCNNQCTGQTHFCPRQFDLFPELTMSISAPSDCSPSVQDGASMLHIAAVERETGIAKDTLRVWEKRYGFPQPLRDTTGDRVYAASQVARLRQIRQLLDAGMRPGKVVGLGAEALARLLAETSVNDLSDLSRTKNAVAPPAQAVSDFLDLIAGHSPQALRHALAHAQLRMGVAPFVTELLAPLNQAVGEAWVQGRFKVFEEHFYTEVIGSLLRETIASLAPLASARRPKVLLTTLPPEQHGLGLLMVEALLTLEGCCCVSLGTQTPLEDLAHAAHAHHVDLIALSFSSVHPESLVLDNLQALRNQLPQPLGLWVGGACPALYRYPIAGVVPVGLLTNIPGAVARWRRRETETHNTRTTRT